MMEAIRVLFFSISTLLFIGIGLTGFNTVHWLLYVPPMAMLIAGITGICPGLMLLRKIGLR